MTRKTVLILSGLCLGFTASAAERSRVGETTQQWLQLQKSGEQAPRDPRPLSGDVAKRNYERYLKSFETEVPEQFDTGITVE